MKAIRHGWQQVNKNNHLMSLLTFPACVVQVEQLLLFLGPVDQLASSNRDVRLVHGGPSYVSCIQRSLFNTRQLTATQQPIPPVQAFHIAIWVRLTSYEMKYINTNKNKFSGEKIWNFPFQKFWTNREARDPVDNPTRTSKHRHAGGHANLKLPNCSFLTSGTKHGSKIALGVEYWFY